MQQEYLDAAQNHEKNVRPGLKGTDLYALSYMQFLFRTTKEFFKDDRLFDDKDEINIRENSFIQILEKLEMVLCQDLVQVKMRNFSHFNPPEAQPQCVFFHTIVRIHLVTYSYNGYEFVSYCRKLPDIRKSSGMPACNREF